MERAIVILEQFSQLTDDRHLYIVREEKEPADHQHDTHERQLDEWRDVMHRLQNAELKQCA
ncbi:MAG: hypothetical protein KF797_02385 [Flavobacteriales bacterium]|nr:hypothetical protein [Flavobacteriales bacterium]